MYSSKLFYSFLIVLFFSENALAFSSDYRTNKSKEVDILFIVDNTGGMNVHQAKLDDFDILKNEFALERFIAPFANLNWKIAAVTTDNYCVRGVIDRKFFHSSKPKALSKFEKMVRAGDRGDTIERGLEMGHKGFLHHPECGVDNDWSRDTSLKFVVLLSNEENCGSGEIWETTPR